MCIINVNWPIISIYFLSFSSFASISVIAPFFPSEAANKGMSASTAGGVFSIFGFVLILTNAITGKLLPLIGSKITLNIGILFVGLSNIIFGLLDNINNSQVFIVLCFIVRSTEAIGLAFLETTSYVILIKKCGENLGKAVAIKGACISIGLTVGPPLGSLFYSIGGYKLPFLVLGSALLINIPFSIAFENYDDLPERPNQVENEQILSYFRLLSIPKVVIIYLVIFTVSNSYGSVQSTLELYLESYEIGPKYVGYMFMLIPASYTVILLMISKFFAQMSGFKYLTLGLLINTLAFMIIGPSPFFVITGNTVFAASGMLLIGIGNAFALTPSIPTILLITNNEYSNNLTNSSYVSGMYTTVFSLGYTVGPYLGAALYQYFGSEVLFTVIAIANFLCSMISMLQMLNCRRNEEVRRQGYEEFDGCVSPDTVIVAQ